MSFSKTKSPLSRFCLSSGDNISNAVLNLSSKFFCIRVCAFFPCAVILIFTALLSAGVSRCIKPLLASNEIFFETAAEDIPRFLDIVEQFMPWSMRERNLYSENVIK